MRFFYCLWLLVFILLSTSCTKEEPTNGPTSVTGQVVSSHDGRAVPHAEVILFRTNDDHTGALGMQTLEKKQADEQGNFDFNFDAEDGYSYYVKASAQHYFETEAGKSLNNGRKNENFKVSVNPKGYLKLDIQNDEPKDYLMQMRIYGAFNPSIIFVQFNNDTTIWREIAGGKSTSVVVVKSNGVDIKETQDFYCGALDTVNLKIKY